MGSQAVHAGLEAPVELGGGEVAQRQAQRAIRAAPGQVLTGLLRFVDNHLGGNHIEDGTRHRREYGPGDVNAGMKSAGPQPIRTPRRPPSK